MITIQLATQNEWQSALIRYGTRSEFSHVDVVLEDGSLLGARMDGGVQIRKPDYAKFSKTQRFTASLTPEQEKEFMWFVKSQVGKPYDFSGIVGFFIQHDFKNRTSWFCSHLVAAAFQHVGYPLLRVPNGDRVTPRDLTTSMRLDLA